MSLNLKPQVSQFHSIIDKYSKKYKVPYDVIYNTIVHESNGDPKAFNPMNNENSRGLMQISQPTALTSPLNIPLILIDRLYEPDFNIEHGTKYLAYVRDFLKPYYKGKDEKLFWLIISSSYNQGMGYYKKALEYINENGEPLNWEHIKYRVLNPVGSTRRPWPENVEKYAQRIVGVLDDDSFKTAMKISIPVLAGMGLVGYWFMFLRGKRAR